MIKILLEITLCLFVLFVIYKAVLEQTAMHRFKRFYLLFSLILSGVIPFIHFETENKVVTQLPSAELITEAVIEVFTPAEPVILEPPTTSVFVQEIPANEVKAAKNYLPLILGGLYGLVTLILLIRYINGLFQIVKKTKKGQRLRHNGATIILLQEAIVPHNFMNYIFMNQGDYKNEAFREKLLTHELGHASQKHSIDILLIELLKAFFWFNPLYYLYGKAIRQNHEYLADQMVINSFGNITAYQKLLLGFVKRTNQMELSLVSPSNYSLTRKRFEMMKRKLSKRGALIRLTLLLPAVCFAAFFFLFESKANEALEDATTNIVDSFQQILNPENKPDISPIDTEKYTVQSINGYSRGTKLQFTSHYDSIIGTEIFSLPEIPVRATSSGLIIEIKMNHKSLGNYIKIKHNETFETFYGKLENINVKLNQAIVKGETIGTIGTKGDLFGRFHYKVFKNGKAVSPSSYLNGKMNKMSIFDFILLPKDRKQLIQQYNLKPHFFSKNFRGGLAYEKILFDDEKAVFIKSSGESTVKKSTELNDNQKKAILAVTSAPLRHPNKRKVPSEVYERWENPTVYRIWIDGEEVPNSVMSQYQASDFAHSNWSVLSKDLRKLKKHAFELWLQTEEYYDQAKQKSKERERVWMKETIELFNQIGSI